MITRVEAEIDVLEQLRSYLVERYDKLQKLHEHADRLGELQITLLIGKLLDCIRDQLNQIDQQLKDCEERKEPDRERLPF